MFKDKRFNTVIKTIAIPVALQNLLMSALNTLDTVMISSLGDAAISAVGLANQIFFFLSLICFGITTGSSVLIAQFWGKEDNDSIKKVHGMSLMLSVIVAIIFTIAAQIMPDKLMKIFIDKSEVVAYGVDYLRTVSFSYVLTSITFAYAVAMRSVGNAKSPLAASIVAFIANTFFNYCLIFGKLGFPKLGVVGGALGTIIARFLELSVILYVIYKFKGPINASYRELTSWDKNFYKRYFKTASPVIINETFWSLGQVIYSVAYAKLGTEAITALQVGMAAQNILFVLVRGLSSACTVMIGNDIGAGKEESAFKFGNNFLILSALAGIVSGLLLIILRPAILLMFPKISMGAYKVSMQLMVVIGITFFIRTYNSTLIVGILRGGGDTKYSMILEMSSVWLIGIPMAFLGASVLHVPLYAVYLLVSLEELVKAIVGIIRVRSKKWIKNVTV